MKSERISIIVLALISSHCFICAGEITNISTNPTAEMTGDYAPTRTNGRAFFVDPPEFWSGPWKQSTNGWRVQLRVYNQTNFMLRNGAGYPVSTNLMLSVEWGSPVKDSGGGYFVAPNGKFAKFELLDAKGNIVPPMPRAGNHALQKWGHRTPPPGGALCYGTDLPAWLSLQSGSLVAAFPETTSTNVYPRFAGSDQMVGEIWSFANRSPAFISMLPLNEIYFVSNEGDYTLTVQPVLYKQGNHADAAILDRVDLPSVTTEVHLAPDVRKMGGYTVMRGTNGLSVFVDPSEFWNGVWKEGPDGWRVQLRVSPPTTWWGFQEGGDYRAATNVILRVEWGSALKDSGGGYFLAPNGKFAKFELLDAKGNVVPPNPKAGTNLLERFMVRGLELTHGPDLPKWVSQESGSLVAKFPKTASTNAYPHFPNGQIAGEIESPTNRPPFDIAILKLDEVYSITNEGDYTLTVQPVLYKQGNQGDRGVLDRVDLPSVTTKVHLVPEDK